MSTRTAPAILLDSNIPTGNRSVFPKGKPPTATVMVLGLIPAMGFGIALADDRIGFKLFMAGLGVSMLIFTVALYFWTQAVAAGVIRISPTGTLRFMPAGYLRPLSYAVAFGFLVPGAIKFTVVLLHLPTMQTSTRLVTWGPYAIGLITIVSLVKLLLSSRVPEGLTVGPDGLSGVRGAMRVEVAWDELVSASALGEFGPKLTLLTRSRGALFVDSHYFGSDPAIVAAVIEYYRENPTQRAQLADGRTAIRTVETISRPR